MPKVGKVPEFTVKKKILYQWWGPKGTFQKSPTIQRSDKFGGLGRTRRRQTAKIGWQIVGKVGRSGIHPGLDDIDLTPDMEIGVTGRSPGTLFHKDQSPPYSFRYDCGSEKDPMLAVGHNYVILTHAGTIRFFDRQGNLLTMPDGFPNLMSVNAFPATWYVVNAIVQWIQRTING